MKILEAIKLNINYIKSPYVLKGVFSFLSQRQKMDIIKYNKQLQKNYLILMI